MPRTIAENGTASNRGDRLRKLDSDEFLLGKSRPLRRRRRPGAVSLHRGLRQIEHPEKRGGPERSEEHTSELQSLAYLVCRLLLEKKKNNTERSVTGVVAP